ncbi:MAG: hypothetical protein L0Y72_19450 [Gemmataceae bacterium]|nr:hypothetical protein [Gemmataceae bacterium]MCI0741212.1 hypothetical protein [Gemmataceae bacterium]
MCCRLGLLAASFIFVGQVFNLSAQVITSPTGQAETSSNSKGDAGAKTGSAAKLDVHGDPLPDGALMRFGTSRFRFGGGGISAAALSPDGKLLVTSQGGDVVTLADPATGKLINNLRLPGGFGVAAMQFTNDSKRLVTMSYGPQIQVVDMPSGKSVAKLTTPQQNVQPAGLSISPDGNFVAVGTNNFGQPKNSVYLFEVSSSKLLHSLEVIQNNQIKAAIAPNGALVATWGYYIPKGGENDPDQGRTVQVFDGKTGKELRKIVIDRNQIMGAAFSPDGKTLAVASGMASFHLFDAESGKEQRGFAGRRGQGQQLHFSPDGKLLVAAAMDGTVQVWETSTNKRVGLSDRPRQRLFSLAFPKEGEVWALGSEGATLSMWNAVTGKSLAPEDGHHFWIRTLAFSSDGKTLLSTSAEGKVCWWDTATGKELRNFILRDDPHNRYGSAYNSGGYALSRDGKYLAAATDYGMGAIRVWDLANGQVLCDFDAPRFYGNAPSFGFSPDGSKLAAVGQRSVLVWDVSTGMELPSLPFKDDPNANQPGGGNGGSIAFTPDGKLLAASRNYYDRTTGTPLGEVYLYNVEKRSLIHKLDRAGQFPGALTFSADGKLLAVPMQDRTVLLLRAGTGKEVGRLNGSQQGGVQALAFSPDGRLVAGSQVDNVYRSAVSVNSMVVGSLQPRNRIVLWELASGQIRQDFVGHEGAVAALAFSPNGKALATGGFDTTIVLWDLKHRASEKFAVVAPEEMDQLWNDLTHKEAKQALKPMQRLLDSPKLALDFLQEHLQPVKAPDIKAEEIEKLIADLDHENFNIRAKANRSLEQLGEVAGPALRKAADVDLGLEVARRIKSLVEKLDKGTLTPEEVRWVRAVEVLESLASPEALAMLESLARGAPQARLTLEAREALGRLRQSK